MRGIKQIGCLKIGFLIVLFCMSLSEVQGQNWISPVNPFKSKTEIIYGIDNRRTHIYQHNTLIYGLYFGIGFEDKLRFKIGLTGTPFEQGKFVDDDGLLSRNKSIFLNLGEEFDYYIKYRFRLTSYVQVGVGYNFYRKINDAEVETEVGKKLIIPIELGTHMNYDLNSWARLKLGGGWRIVAPEESNTLSGFYIKAGVGIHGKNLLNWHRSDQPLFDLKSNK